MIVADPTSGKVCRGYSRHTGLYSAGIAFAGKPMAKNESLLQVT